MIKTKGAANNMPTNKTSTSSARVNMEKKQPLFYVIAILLPFLFLLTLEGLLRLSGFGNTYPLFIESSYKPEYLQANPEIVKRFFHQPEFAPPVGPDTFLFKKDKKPNSLRIVLMGGSSAAGFPYGRFGSPAAMLHQQVKAHFPNSDIEIISVAMASINSYALLDFIDEVIQIKPNAVLVYAGHNEFLGIMGVGSVYASKGSHAANLTFLKLKELRIFQLVQSFYKLFFQSFETIDHSDKSRTVMASVAKEKSIEFGSDLFERGLAQFEQNMMTIQSEFARANVPLYISTIASNEKDLSPFSSNNSPEVEQLLDNTKPRSHRRIIQQGLKLLEKGHQSADLAYEVAHAMLSESDERAAAYFKLSADYDLLRFRAPSIFNQIIQELGTKNASTFIVDSEKAIRNDADAGIIGAEHMLEHLHPTPRGYFLIGDAFYNRLLDNNIFSNFTDVDVDKVQQVDSDKAWQNMPLSEVDLMVGAYKIKTLTSDYPFTNNKIEVAAPQDETALQKIAKRRIEGESWLNTQQQLLTILQQQGNILEAAKVAGLLHDALPDEADAARVASLLYLQINELGLGEYYARRALNISTNEKQIIPNYYLTLAEIVFKSGKVNEALSILNDLLRAEPNNQRALAIKQIISA
jgi:tetratricopeptide (TPR) repeat protein